MLQEKYIMTEISEHKTKYHNNHMFNMNIANTPLTILHEPSK